MASLRALVVVPLFALLAACGGSDTSAPASSAGSTGTAAPGAAAVTAQRLLAADSEPGQWLSHGRTYGEQRFSPLAQIDTTNVGELGLAWFGDFGIGRAQESTPLY